MADSRFADPFLAIDEGQGALGGKKMTTIDFRQVAGHSLRATHGHGHGHGRRAGHGGLRLAVVVPTFSGQYGDMMKLAHFWSHSQRVPCSLPRKYNVSLLILQSGLAATRNDSIVVALRKLNSVMQCFDDVRFEFVALPAPSANASFSAFAEDRHSTYDSAPPAMFFEMMLGRFTLGFT